MPKGYTTRAEVENYLLINIDETFWAQVDKWIEAMEAYVDKITGRSSQPAAGQTASTRLYDGNGTSNLYIDDASSITKVEIGGEGAWTEVLAADYLKYPAQGSPIKKLFLPAGVWSRGYQNVRITANWGSTVVPADLSFATTVLVAGIINNSYSSEGEIQSMTIGPYSVSYKTQEQVSDFDKVKEILQLNKRFYF